MSPALKHGLSCFPRPKRAILSEQTSPLEAAEFASLQQDRGPKTGVSNDALRTHRPILPNKARGTICYNRFVRWRRAGVWGRIMDALAAAHDAAVQMIDTSVRVHQHAATL